MEQEPINREVEKALSIKNKETDAVKNPQYIKDIYRKAIPTIVYVQDGTIRERCKGVVRQKQLVDI